MPQKKQERNYHSKGGNPNAAQNASGLEPVRADEAEIQEKLERMDVEERRLWNIVSESGEVDERLVVTVEQLAVMRITMEDLTSHVTEYGHSVVMKNGSQIIKQQSPESKTLNDTRKIYLSLLKQFESMIPERAVVERVVDEFEEYQNRKPK